jgi:hypothetical protein
VDLPFKLFKKAQGSWGYIDRAQAADLFFWVASSSWSWLLEELLGRIKRYSEEPSGWIGCSNYSCIDKLPSDIPVVLL